MKAALQGSLIAITVALLLSVTFFLVQPPAAPNLEGATLIDSTWAITIGAVCFALAALIWSVRTASATRHLTRDWTDSLASMEARWEKSESILASHPGLVLVWSEADTDVLHGWGRPRVLGGPAALASLITFASEDPDAFLRPAESLLDAFADLPVAEDQISAKTSTLRERVHLLRSEGVSFSGTVVTEEGRSIECAGRVAGDQVTLWLTDPAVRLAEEAGARGQVRDRASDLHGAYNALDRAPIAAWRRSPDLKLEWVNKAYVDMVEAINMDEVIAEQKEFDAACQKVADKARTEHERSGRKAADDLIRV
ncbi:MAG: hypothetical protein HRU11_09250, partial [Parvularculaceae bacterium]|nr:hypothetical protein [Parvularculaceae bacterium]